MARHVSRDTVVSVELFQGTSDSFLDSVCTILLTEVRPPASHAHTLRPVLCQTAPQISQYMRLSPSLPLTLLQPFCLLRPTPASQMLSPGDFLFKTDDVCRCLYIVNSGSVEIVNWDPNTSEYAVSQTLSYSSRD